MKTAQDRLRHLQALAGLAGHRTHFKMFTLGANTLEFPALEYGAVHEIFAAHRDDAPAAAGFVAGLIMRLSGSNTPALWVRNGKDRSDALYGGGLATLGYDPARLIHLSLKDEKDVLRASLEGLRCKGLSAVVIEMDGPSRTLDMTATRRMKLAAAEHGVTALILRSGAAPGASAAQTRWQVATLLSVSPGWGLPGNPTFRLTLLKHRSLEPGRVWEMEWDNETGQFAPKALSRPVATLSFDRTYREAGDSERTRAG